VEWVSDPQLWIAFATLAALEIVLGIDNIVFISILVGKLPEDRRSLGYRLGLGLAMVMRIALLMAISWIMHLTRPFFSVFGHDVSGRDLVLILGGLFLVAKATFEIHDDLEGKEKGGPSGPGTGSFAMVMAQIMVLDLVFSLDSVITAVGMVEEVEIMIAAIVTAVLVMMLFAKTVGDFVGRHPTIRMLALSFLLMIGVMLMVEGTGNHVPKGYIYFAMAFSLFVEILNMKAGKRGKKPVQLR
jgi:predicted tellurium resistance membrane protein TerC